MPVSNKQETTRGELLADVADHAAVIMEKHGLSPLQATSAGLEIADTLANHWGGQVICIPKDMKRKWQERREAICRDFKGDNHGELAQKYGLSVRAIYKIIKRGRQ